MSPLWVSYRSMTSGLSLKLSLNWLVYHRKIFGSSSEVFGNLRKSSDIFGNVRKMFGNVCLVFETILENIRNSSESGRKSSENHQKRRHQHVYIIKRTLHGGLKIRILFSRGKNKIHIFAPPCNILYVYKFKAWIFFQIFLSWIPDWIYNLHAMKC